ncbi:hypothetical protein AVEN_61645-1, partial [Araneus ventricosus]
SEALLKNGKEGNPDMCIIVPDEDEKPPEIAYQNPPGMEKKQFHICSFTFNSSPINV